MTKGDSVVVFIAEGVSGMTLQIPRKGKTAAETKIFDAARADLNGNKVTFRPLPRQYRRSQAVVHTAAVASAVRVLAKRPKEHYRIHEDLKLLKIRCPYCDFTRDTNTEADQLALAEHIATDCPGPQEQENLEAEREQLEQQLAEAQAQLQVEQEKQAAEKAAAERAAAEKAEKAEKAASKKAAAEQAT